MPWSSERKWATANREKEHAVDCYSPRGHTDVFRVPEYAASFHCNAHDWSDNHACLSSYRESARLEVQLGRGCGCNRLAACFSNCARCARPQSKYSPSVDQASAPSEQ